MGPMRGGHGMGARYAHNLAPAHGIGQDFQQWYNAPSAHESRVAEAATTHAHVMKSHDEHNKNLHSVEETLQDQILHLKKEVEKKQGIVKGMMIRTSEMQDILQMGPVEIRRLSAEKSALVLRLHQESPKLTPTPHFVHHSEYI